MEEPEPAKKFASGRIHCVNANYATVYNSQRKKVKPEPGKGKFPMRSLG